MDTDAALTGELNAALQQFQALLDPREINARQEPTSPTVYTPWVVVWLLVYQRLHANASLEAAVGELFRIVDQLPKNRRIEEETLSTNTGSYSRARSRLLPEVTEAVADHVFESLMRGSPPSWEERRVYILDGTTSKLSSSSHLRELYPPAENQHGRSVWPIMHWAVAHELSSGCALRPETGAMYGPEAVSEITLALRLLPRIPANSVLLADRNFGMFQFVHTAKAASHDTVTRLTESRFRALQREAQEVEPGVWELLWKPTAADRRKHPELPADASAFIRLHATLGRDAHGKEFTLWFATTLITSSESLAALYQQRQHVETDIRNVKVALQMDTLRGRSAPMLRKEVAIGMVAYNLVIQIRRLAARQAGVEPRRLSFTGVWSLVKAVLLDSTDWTAEQFAKKFSIVIHGCTQRKLPLRPGRTYPRQVLPRGRKYPERPRITEPEHPK